MRKLATIRRVDDVRPIDGADRIELAWVGGWKCVIKKGEFKPGDIAVYCEIDSFLPIRDEFEFLRASSLKFIEDDDGGRREGFRLRTVKLRGQISQGLLLPIDIVPGGPHAIGDDVTEALGIVKYEAPIPSSLSGEVVGGFPSFIEKTDEERIQNLSDAFDGFADRTFYLSEKLDGTSFTAYMHEGRFGVCGRNYKLSRSERNSHWRVAVRTDLQTGLETLGRSIAIQGELIGPKIQGNRYALQSPMVRVFNVYDIDAAAYVAKSEMESLCETLGLQTVPPLGVSDRPETIDAVLSAAEGKSVLNSKVEREGVVWVSDSPTRVSFKAISNRFLAKAD